MPEHSQSEKQRPARRAISNRLNDLSAKEWLKFQKSWFVHNPPPRRKDVLRHPAKFPETLAQEFIEFFTKRGQVVFDPMAGTASTLIAALRAGRRAYGIELNPRYVQIAQQWIEEEKAHLSPSMIPDVRIFQGNALQAADILTANALPPIDYLLTSPPYWNMLHAPGFETQSKRRSSPHLDVVYSDDPADLGNIESYELFLERLCELFAHLKPFLRPKAYLTIIVKNIKKGGRIYPLAWDLGRRLGEIYTLKDEKIWLQDNQRLAPYGYGTAWVSNTFHHYCLQFRNE
ncbi:MAG: site-specific DNA-methyltransferase [Anaerolineae bacterium]|jgi:DNA modification methylase|nr:MAG: site-specific DNA-methyltransferase [Anaerolineae bacterium]